MPRLLLNPKQATLWHNNAIIAGNGGKHDSDAFDGTLSIKSVLRGRVAWNTPDGRYILNENTYLVLNHGQKYNLNVLDPANTFCVFFQPGYIGDVAASLKAQDLLETATTHPTGFYERINPHDHLITPILDEMHRHVTEDLEPIEHDELYLRLATALLVSQKAAKRQSLSLPLTRATTREEIYKRLGTARNYVLSNITCPLTVADIAAEAHLSPFHFHRLFRAAFNQTPHEFITRQRLQRAKTLLTQTRDPLTEICLNTGFESQASFCRLFKKHVGLTPTEFRKTAD